MTKRIPGRALVALVGISIMAVWVAASYRGNPIVKQVPDYNGPDAVVHARGTLNNQSDGSQLPFDVWYDKAQHRFRMDSANGVSVLYQEGTVYQLPSGATGTQRLAEAMDFEAAAEKYLHVVRWVVDESTHQDLPVLESESVNGIAASKKQVGDSYYIWSDAGHRLLKIAPTDNSAAAVMVSYDEFRHVAPNEVPTAALSASLLPTMGPQESSYGVSNFRPDRPEEMAAMYAMDDYDAYWLGLEYKALTFSFGDRTVTEGYAVEMVAPSSGQNASRKDNFSVTYEDMAHRTGGSGVLLDIVSTPLTAFHTTLAMVPGASNITLLDGTSAWLVDGTSHGGSKFILFEKGDVQIQITSLDAPVDLLEIASQLRLIRDDAP